MVLNSLAIDPQREWKGPWRWFTEDLLVQCCFDHQDFSTQGASLTQLAGCARCNGAQVKLRLADDPGESIESFRKNLKECTVEEMQRRMIVSFDRSTLDQTGSGHFSSIGAFHPEKDLVLVMEVARFKYFPFWCPVEVMWNAMKGRDTESGLTRGYMVVSPGSASVGHCPADHGNEQAVGPHVCEKHDHHPADDQQVSSQLCWRQAVDKFGPLLHDEIPGTQLESPWLSLSHRLSGIFTDDMLADQVRTKVQSQQVAGLLGPLRAALEPTTTRGFVARSLDDAKPDSTTVDLASLLVLGFAQTLQRSGSESNSRAMGTTLQSVAQHDLQRLELPLKSEVNKISDMMLMLKPNGRMIGEVEA